MNKQPDIKADALAHYRRGLIYRRNPLGEHQSNLEKAASCFEAALALYTPQDAPLEWARTLHLLGTTYHDLLDFDVQTSPQKAINCFKSALQVYTRETFPSKWATLQRTLGQLYTRLQATDRAQEQQNLLQAIVYFKQALNFYTRELYLSEWAAIQNSLGTACLHLLDVEPEERQVYLQQALACFQLALEGYPPESAAFEWAALQYNIGHTYHDLFQETETEHRQVKHLEKAITAYEASLQIYTREDFPFEWAITQQLRGQAYGLFPSEESLNLTKALLCQQAALHVFESLDMPAQSQFIQTQIVALRTRLRTSGSNSN